MARGVIRSLTALTTSIALIAGSLLVAAPADAAAVDQQCSYANPGSGTYAQTLCWLDMTDYAQAAASSAGGQQMQVALPGGYVLRYSFRNFQYVQPKAVDVLLPVPAHPGTAATDRLITITTCNPPFHAAERLIAYGTFQSWQPPTEIPAPIASIVARS